MKTAWLFSENADYIERVRKHNHQDFTTIGVIANRAALAGGEDWLNQLLPYIDANHNFVESFIRERMPLVRSVKPQGTFLCWLDVSRLEEKIGAAGKAAEANRQLAPGTKPLTAENMVERWLVENAKVQMNAGTNYGLGGAGHMRMNIGTSRKTLELALTSMADAMKRL